MKWCELGFHKWCRYKKDYEIESDEGIFTLTIYYKKCERCGKKERVSMKWKEFEKT